MNFTKNVDLHLTCFKHDTTTTRSTTTKQLWLRLRLRRPFQTQIPLLTVNAATQLVASLFLKWNWSSLLNRLRKTVLVFLQKAQNYQEKTWVLVLPPFAWSRDWSCSDVTRGATPKNHSFCRVSFSSTRPWETQNSVQIEWTPDLDFNVYNPCTIIGKSTSCYCPAVTCLWQSLSMVWRSDNQHRMFCAELWVQPEEIVLCTMSTYLDPQLLPYIQAFILNNQLSFWRGDAYLCMLLRCYIGLVLWTIHLSSTSWSCKEIPENAAVCVCGKNRPCIFLSPWPSPQSLHYEERKNRLAKECEQNKKDMRSGSLGHMEHHPPRETTQPEQASEINRSQTATQQHIYPSQLKGKPCYTPQNFFLCWRLKDLSAILSAV